MFARLLWELPLVQKVSPLSIQRKKKRKRRRKMRLKGVCSFILSQTKYDALMLLWSIFSSKGGWWQKSQEERPARLLWENTTIPAGEHNEGWLLICITAPCKLGSFPTGSDRDPWLLPPYGAVNLWHVFSKVTMEQGERTETVRSQAQERLPTAVHVLLATGQSPGPTLLLLLLSHVSRVRLCVTP